MVPLVFCLLTLVQTVASNVGLQQAVFISGLREALVAAGASGDRALSGTAVLQQGTYLLNLGIEAVDVAGSLVISGAGGAGSTSSDAASGTVLDLSKYQDITAFRLLNGSSLVLSNLILLLPPVPAEALAASPPSVLAHVVGGSPGRVVLEGVELVLAGRGDLEQLSQRLCDPFAWRHNVGQLQLLNGTVLYGNGTMPLSAANADTAAASTPPARLVRSSVTCSGGPRPPPWVCSATHVGDGAELRATAEALLASSSAFVLLSLAANVTLEPGSWSGSLEVPSGVYLGLYGNPEQGAALQLDFAGLESAIRTTGGFVLLRDLTLLGLPYPEDVTEIRHLLAVWIHSVFISRRPPGFISSRRPAIGLRCIRCTLVLPRTEAAWWRNAALAFVAAQGGNDTGAFLPESWMLKVEASTGAPSSANNLSGSGNGSSAGAASAEPAGAVVAGSRYIVTLLDDNKYPIVSLNSCALVSLEESGAVASPPAAAVASVWPFGSTYEADEAVQLRLGIFQMQHIRAPDLLLALAWTSTPGTTFLLPTRFFFFHSALPPGRPSGNATLVFSDTADKLPYVVPSDPLPEDAPCTLRGLPQIQTHRRTAWDVQGRPEPLYLKTSSPLTLEDLVIYNMPPAGPYESEELNAPPALPPPYGSDGGDLSSSDGSEGRADGNWGGVNAAPGADTDGDLSGSLNGAFNGPSGAGTAIVSDSSAPPTSFDNTPSQSLELGYSNGPPPVLGLPPTYSPTFIPSSPDPILGPITAEPEGSIKYYAPLLPPPPPPAPVTWLDRALESVSLPIWKFRFNRSSEVPILRLRRVTLVVPPAELALLLRLLGSAGRLPAPPPPPNASYVGGTGRRRLEAAGLPGWRGRFRSLQDDSDNGGAASQQQTGLPCLHSVLLRFAATADVAWYTDTTISFTALSFHGWSGRDVVVTSDFPPDAPTLRMAPAADLSPGLEAACPPPPYAAPSRPAPASLPPQPAAPSPRRLPPRQTEQEPSQSAATSSGGGGRKDHRRRVVAAAVAATVGMLFAAVAVVVVALVRIRRRAARRRGAGCLGSNDGQAMAANTAAAGINPFFHTELTHAPLTAQQAAADAAPAEHAAGGARALVPARSAIQQWVDEAALLCPTGQSNLPGTNTVATAHPAVPVSSVPASGSAAGSAAGASGAPAGNAGTAPGLLHSLLALTGEREAALQQALRQRAPEGGGNGGSGGSNEAAGTCISFQLSAGGRFRDVPGIFMEQNPLSRAIQESMIWEDDRDTTVHLLSVLGTGSFGIVHLGLWRGLAIAVKMLVMHDTLLGTEGRRRQRAVLEAAIGTALDHPNVVATFAYDVRPLGEQPSNAVAEPESATPGRVQPNAGGGGAAPDVYQLYIMQELCSGGSLFDALGPRGALRGGLLSGGPAAAAAVLHLAFQVAAGLRHVHAAGIVHGDVSAGNVLLARREEPQRQLAPGAKDGRGDPDMERQDGDGDAASRDPAEASWRSRLARATHGSPPPVVAKVADFGLSLRLTGSRTHASGMHQGTPVYAAPEVIRDGRVSRASDVYSFGVLLLELFLGRPAAELWEAAAAAAQRNSSHPQSAESHPLLAVLDAVLPPAGGIAWFPPQLRPLVADCLSVNPSDRPTFDQVADALVGAIEAIS